MKPIPTLLAAITGLVATAAVAQDATSVPDVNGDGAWSMEEVAAAVPDLTAETFAAIDTDANGSLNADELAVAITAGTITPAG